MAERITNAQIHEKVVALNGRMGEGIAELKELNGSVTANTTRIAILESREEQHSVNWDRIINIATAIIVALVLAKLSL